MNHVPGWFGPAHVEFGSNLIVGEHVFINFNATILAQAKVTLADHVMIGPNCSLSLWAIRSTITRCARAAEDRQAHHRGP